MGCWEGKKPEEGHGAEKLIRIGARQQESRERHCRIRPPTVCALQEVDPSTRFLFTFRGASLCLSALPSPLILAGQDSG